MSLKEKGEQFKNAVAKAKAEAESGQTVTERVSVANKTNPRRVAWSRVEHFTADEFRCGHGSCPHCGGDEQMRPELVERLEAVRRISGMPMHINSGYRCEGHNRDEQGTRGSAHCGGYAADIATPDSSARFKLVSAALMVGFRRIGTYPWGVHLDCDPGKPQDVIWHE